MVRCLRGIAWVSLATWLLLSAALLGVVQHEAHTMSDTSLRELAEMALAFADHELDEIQSSNGPGVSDAVDASFSDKVVYQVWQPGRRLAYRSVRAPTTALTDGADGFGQIQLQGETLRSYTAWNPEHTFQIQMAAWPDERRVFSTRLSLAVIAGLLLALAVFQWLMRRSLDHAFAPLRETAETLARKPAADLSPVDAAQHAPEFAPVIQAFNGLMQRVSRLLRHEQRFTSDAAHELRTPLSGLKVLVRNVRRARSEAEREEALAEMDRSIDRSTRLIQQLLALARYDGDPSQLVLDEPVILGELAQHTLADLRPLADERGTRVELRTEAGMPHVRGNREALASLLRNLLENALLYTPPGGCVRIESWAHAAKQRAGWRVHDSGPGVPLEMRERVFARFFRMERNASNGSGLGLALVQRIAEVHGGEVHVECALELGGAMVVVSLPMAPQ
jgi:signal transduction histidine kinase